MLHLKTDKGERLELPASAVIAVMKPSTGENPCSLLFDMGGGPTTEKLGDQFGYVRKLVADSQLLVNAIELTIIEPSQAADAKPGDTAEGVIYFSRDRIMGRREVIEDSKPAGAILYVNLFGHAQPIRVANTLDEMDGVEPPKAPKRARATKPKEA